MNGPRIHFSCERIDKLRLGIWGQLSHAAEKPEGFWYSVETDPEDGWHAWSEAEGFRTDSLAHRHDVELDLDRILQIRCRDDLERLQADYGEPMPFGRISEGIRWDKIASGYAGVEMAPYDRCLDASLKLWWVSAWDCASGCVWDLSAIQSFDGFRL